MSLDVPALERLVKDDKELEIQLKHGVIMNFVDRYLRGLLKDEFLQAEIKKVRESIQTAVDSVAAKEIGTLKDDGWRSTIFTLNSKFKEKLTSQIGIEVDIKVGEMIRNRIDNAISGIPIKKMVEDAVAARVTALTKEEVEKKVKEAIAGAFAK